MVKRAFIADDIGLVKDLSFETGNSEFVSNQTGSGLEVVSLCLVNKDPCEVAMSRVDGSLEITALTEETHSWKNAASIDLEEPVAQMTSHGSSLICLTESCVYIVDREGDSLRITNKHALPKGPYGVVRFNKARESNAAPTQVIAASDHASPVVIDIASGNIAWTGKNAPDTTIGLRSIFRTECICPLATDMFVSADSTGKLRFFNTAFQRKPLLEFPVFQAFNVTNNYTGTSGMGQTRPIKHLEVSVDGKTLFLGDTYGSLIALDVSKIVETQKVALPEEAKIGTKKHLEFCRKLMPMKFSLPGVMGSVRRIAVTEEHVYVVTAGRYAYVFELKSKGKKFNKVFMKQKLTCCLPLEFLEQTVEPSLEDPEQSLLEDDGSADDENLRDLLDSMESKVDDDKSFMSKAKRRRTRKGASKH